VNETDYIIIAVLGLSVMVGLWRGLVSEVLALVVWVAAFWAAWVFGPVLAVHLEGWVRQPSLRIIGAYVVCFVLVLVVGALLRVLARKLIDGVGLAGPDRVLGGVFGLARGILVVTLAVFLVGFTAFTRDAWWQGSILLPHFRQAAVWMEHHTPKDVGKYLHPPHLEQLPSLQTLVPAPILTSPRPAMPESAASIQAADTAAVDQVPVRTRQP
jgi:membrane protein required for colicin V production